MLLIRKNGLKWEKFEASQYIKNGGFYILPEELIQKFNLTSYPKIITQDNVVADIILDTDTKQLAEGYVAPVTPEEQIKSLQDTLTTNQLQNDTAIAELSMLISSLATPTTAT